MVSDDGSEKGLLELECVQKATSQAKRASPLVFRFSVADSDGVRNTETEPRPRPPHTHSWPARPQAGPTARINTQ